MILGHYVIPETARRHASLESLGIIAGEASRSLAVDNPAGSSGCGNRQRTKPATLIANRRPFLERWRALQDIENEKMLSGNCD